MGASCPENLSSLNKTKMTQELLRGRELTTQLRALLQQNPSREGGRNAAMAEELVLRIFRSFSDSLSLVNPENSHLGVSVSGHRQSETSGERKRSSPETSKEKRGCYKRWKNSESRTVTSSSMEDGHAWRKYGQKDILNSKYPRAYFRCTRKFDQGCKATRQVQKMSENPDVFQILYIGVHTCKDELRAPQIIADSDSSNPFAFSSESNHFQYQNLIRPVNEEDTMSGLTDNNNNISNEFSTSMDWREFLSLDSSEQSLMMKMGCDDQGDKISSSGAVYSCTDAYDPELDMDDLLGSVDFDSDFVF